MFESELSVVVNATVTQVQVKPLEEIILGVEFNIFIDITIVVTAFGHMAAVDAIALLLATKGSSDFAQHGHLGDSGMVAWLTHLDYHRSSWNSIQENALYP